MPVTRSMTKTAKKTSERTANGNIKKTRPRINGNWWFLPPISGQYWSRRVICARNFAEFKAEHDEIEKTRIWNDTSWDFAIFVCSSPDWGKFCESSAQDPGPDFLMLKVGIGRNWAWVETYRGAKLMQNKYSGKKI